MKKSKLDFCVNFFLLANSAEPPEINPTEQDTTSARWSYLRLLCTSITDQNPKLSLFLFPH